MVLPPGLSPSPDPRFLDTLGVVFLLLKPVLDNRRSRSAGGVSRSANSTGWHPRDQQILNAPLAHATDELAYPAFGICHWG